MLKDLLEFFDLDGVVVTIEIMHTQVRTTERIRGYGSHYVPTVKGNQPHPPLSRFPESLLSPPELLSIANILNA